MNLFDLSAKISLDSSEFEKGLKDTESLINKLGTGIKTAFKVGAAAVTTTTAAVGAFGAKAVKAYSDYEQLAGGVETLFKESADTVKKYADDAYKTSGLNANAYMKTVTGFSASLLQSLSGDTEKAANVADMAIKDMSDNANKMGTSMESIQVAYQGFAKQNYTINLMSAA